MAAVLANGGGFYHPFAYVAEARRMGITILPPDVNASEFRTTGKGRELRIGLQFVTGLSASGGDAGTRGRPYRDFADFRTRARLSHDDLRTLIKAGACDSIANGMTRPMMLWAVDREAGRPGGRGAVDLLPPSLAASLPRLPNYSPERKRQDEYSALGFLTERHPMALYAERLRRFRLVKSPDLPKHVGQRVLLAGMLTTAKPVHTVTDEPMQFATFDDGDGLVEAVLFPEVYRTRGHVLFDQGPFLLKGKVEEEFGAITLTVTHLERVDRMLARLGA
jgi:DNA polymerase III alpha subunit